MSYYAITNNDIDVTVEKDHEAACIGCDCPQPWVRTVILGTIKFRACDNCLDRLKNSINDAQIAYYGEAR